MSFSNYNDGSNYTDGFPPSFDSPTSDEDKATQTRRKNAEAQKQYRERKKEHEKSLLNENNNLKEENQQLKALVQALQSSRQQTPPWQLHDAGHHISPSYNGNQTHLAPPNHPVRQVAPDADIIALLGQNYTQQFAEVNSIFQASPVPWNR